MSDLNQGHLPYPVEEHKGRVMCGDPVAIAYEWIMAYAKNLTDQVSDAYDGHGGEITVDELMEVADSHQPDENGNNGWGDYISRGGTFEGESVDPMFWEKYAIVRGKHIDDVDQSSFFSCSC
ncbi:hypothetical protein HYP85_gp041 [Pseudomonas phage Zuri]|uniref:Uncharacterized protein n=1 Tax=Pseudomonas phage Zuri TaxID=2604899 RepID=A0A5C1K5N9_9CAUD|nr:hypothetical protein HYP85_gp041 [Pseudomonas phage Zuri]QEM41138.1 hypothetical protein Zuri_41 [Pseudomonas phage Zuri]